MRIIASFLVLLCVLGCSPNNINEQKLNQRFKMISSGHVVDSNPEITNTDYVEVYVDFATNNEFVCVYKSGCLMTGRKVDYQGNEIK
jgi:hypothetical protein